ncbi:ParA family protein [Candidatus Saccharibacteria bacterium]|nr:ParA family protein [Candidatus Saccharibacteria bacterium]MBQ6147543.1 ParA family protein [Candidatus Saccharibacteria bacterium]
MATVISVTNQKGGVGKTTTAVNLAYYLAKDRFRTLVVDFDPQGNASSGLGVDKNDLRATMVDVMSGGVSMDAVILTTKTKNLDVAPTVPELANAEVELVKAKNRFRILKDAIKRVEGDYDYVIIDSPPSLSLLTVNGMIASDYLLLPVQTEFYALEGVAQLLESMKLVRKAMNPNLQLLGVLATMYDRRTSLSAEVLTEIKKYFKEKTFEVTIPRNVRVAEAPSHGVPVGEYDKFSRGARAYKELAKEVERRTGKK